jgi:hypothetical protein
MQLADRSSAVAIVAVAGKTYRRLSACGGAMRH